MAGKGAWHGQHHCRICTKSYLPSIVLPSHRQFSEEETPCSVMTMLTRNGVTGDDVGSPVGDNDTVGTCDKVGGVEGTAVGDTLGCRTGEEVGSSVGSTVGSRFTAGDAVGVPDKSTDPLKNDMSVQFNESKELVSDNQPSDVGL